MRVEDASQVTFHAGVFLRQRIDFWFLHTLMFAVSRAGRDDLPDAVLSGGDMWFAGSSQCVLSWNWALKKNSGYPWVALRFSAALIVSEHQPADQIETYAFRPG